MFDIGWQEFILIALVAVVVVGPKDLPRVIRTVGQWIRKARSLASEFQGSLEEMAREAELDDVRKQIQDVSKGGIGATIQQHVDPDGEIRKSIEDARNASGTDEIEGALDEARRGAKAVAAGDGYLPPEAPTAGKPVQDYASVAARNKIPDNSVTPPAAAVSETAPARKAPTGKAPTRKAAAGSGKASSKAAAGAPAAKTADKTAAKPRRATKKPPAGAEAGES